MPAPGPYNEQELLIRLSEGDEPAFDQLYNYYQPRLFLYIFPFTGNNKVETEEVLQEIFVKLWIRKESLPAIQSFPNYLFRMARNQLLDIQQKHKKMAVAMGQMPAQSNDALTPAENMLLQEYTQTAKEAILQLSEQRRRIFLLRYEQDMSLDEIAAHLNIAKTSTKNQLYEAVKMVKTYLKENGGWPAFFVALIGRYLE